MTKKTDVMTADLFEELPPEQYPGSMDFKKELSCLFSEIIRDYEKTGKDRHDLAAAISRLTNINVSKQMLDGYTAESRETFNIPFWLVPAAEVAAGSLKFSTWLITKRGGKALFGKDVIQAEIGRLELQKNQAEERIKKLKKGVVS